MRRTAPVLSTAAAICGLLLIAPLPAMAADLGTVTTTDELRAAIALANENGGRDMLMLTPGTTYVLGGTEGDAGNDSPLIGDLDITEDLIIDGNGGAIIDASGIDRAFDVLSGTLILRNVTIVNGNAPDTENGGAVRVAAGAGLDYVGGAMNDNEATNPGPVAAGAGSGGAISTAGDVWISQVSFDGNDATRAGGAIEVEATGAVRINEATFTGNTTTTNAPGNGGALHITGAGTATVTGSTITGNTAAEGGGLWNSAAGVLTVVDSTIDGNTATGAAADQGGGGVFTEGGDVVITGGTINGNAATGAAGSGGGIQNINATVLVTGTEINDNTAVRAGGGVEAGPLLPAESAQPTSTTLTDVTLSGNSTGTAPGNGGAVHITGAGEVLVVDSEVTGNTAVEGGGLWNSATGVMAVSGTTIDGNTATGAAADQGGGGVFTEGGDVAIEGSVITNNVATGAAGSGGGILNLNAGVTLPLDGEELNEDDLTFGLVIADTEISGNTAVRAGGGIEAGPLLGAEPRVTSTVLTNVVLSDNTATGAGAPGNGGGFHQTGEGIFVADESLIAGNTAVEGGGLWNSAAGVMAVSNSTVVGNTATGTDGGGGLYQDGGDAADGALIGFNVTITENSAPNGAGGAVLNAGTALAGLLHGTVTGNESGIAGLVEIGNTILTGNDSADADADVTSVGGNVLNAALPFSEFALAGATDTTGVTDPQLGALGDNGGPTPTMLPATGSPVIDAGLPIIEASLEELEGLEGMDAMAAMVEFVDTDQRGVVRPLDGDGDGRADVDAGAVEAPAVAVAPQPINGGGTTPPARPVTAQPHYTG